MNRYVRKATSILLLKQQRISAILARATSPETNRAELAFDELQASHQFVDSYKYDAYSLWERANARVRRLMELAPALRERGLQTLDAGCGDGMLSVLLAAYGHSTTLVDMEDWRDQQAKHLPFLQSHLESIAQLPDASQHLVTSYNTMEHVEDPGQCLDEMVRILRPGGHIHLHFGPLYCSARGLHAYRTLHMPYPQFLFSEKFIEKKLGEVGVDDLGKRSETLQPLNRWKLAEFEQLYSKKKGMSVLLMRRERFLDYTDIILQYPEAFQGRKLTFPDVRVEALEVLLRKGGAE